MYVNKLVAALPRVEFQCLVVGPQVAAIEGVSPFSDREEEFTDFLVQNAVSEGEGEGESEGEGVGGDGAESGRVAPNEEVAKVGAGTGAVLGVGVDAGVEDKGVMYDALVLQLGSFFRYALYSPASQPPRKQGKWSAIILFPLNSILILTSSAPSYGLSTLLSYPCRRAARMSFVQTLHKPRVLPSRAI